MRARILAVSAIALALFAFVRTGTTSAAGGFELREREHIAIIGNTLAERMQHDGWLETILHARFPKHQLVVRNLGFSADEVATRMRSKNFGTPDEWLAAKARPIGGYEANRFAGANTNADVIFAFFGANESHAGQAGVAAFKGQLAEWITHTRAQRYNGKTAPRIVLFSPIAHEDLKNPDLPDGRENNARLTLYTRAMAEVSKAHNIVFVDLFTPSRQLYAKAGKPLTINGIHLNAEGNRRIAEAIDAALFGAPARPEESYLSRLREAVVDKNFHWFQRYRVTDGYSTYGDRAFLNFVRGVPSNVDADVVRKTPKEDVLPSNYDVLQRELPMLDVMTATRDKRIWAVATGAQPREDPKVADAGVPPPVDARTNFPRTPAFLSGEEGVGKMTIGEGLKVELFASEKEFPELVNPVQMAFDTRGRLWIAVWKTYPHWQPGTPMDDKLLILEDTNADGKADKRIVFAGDLHNPTGFEFYNGGVIVAQGPNLVFLKDTNGDDRYDSREILLHGFDTADTHHTINSFTFDPGGALYMGEGVFHRTQVETPWGPPVRQADGGIYRFEPRTWKLEMYAPMNFPNPHGHVFDGWGRNIVFDATGGQPFYGPSMSTKKYFPDMETKSSVPSPGRVRVRPVGGTDILSSRHFPEALQGNLIVLNVIGFRGLLNYRVSEDGAGLKINEADPILQSSDENFRPVDAEVGPDGALYFVDWHNPIIGHMQHNLRDRTRDKNHGRVYRVTYPGRPLLKPAQIAGAPIPQLLELLKEPEDRVRYRAKIELSGRDTNDVLGSLQKWMDGLDSAHAHYEHHLTEALWVHQWHNRVNEKLLQRMLRSREPRARAAATRVLCYWRDRVATPLALLKAQVNDEHPAVRLEAVRATSFFQTSEAAAVALEALKYPQDRFVAHTLGQAMDTLRRFVPRKILTTASPEALEYQLARLPNVELVQVQRTVTNPQHRAVYVALLTRKGLERQYFDEALGALTKIDRSTRTRVVLDALATVREEDTEAGDRLVRMLLAQPAETLKKERDVFTKAIAGSSSPFVLRAAYGAMMIADGDAQGAWETAAKQSAHRAAALAAIGETRRDAAAFRLLAEEVVRGSDAALRATAIRSLHRLPKEAWPAAEIEPVVRAVVALVEKAPAASRTSVETIDAKALAEKLAEALPDATRADVRRRLRTLGVQVVRVEAVPEQMMFDLKWFAVEAGRPVQIVLANPDAMPHNLLITRPGALKEVGTAASAMAPPTDPNVKAFVPDTPLVLQATRLLNWGETERLNFSAPKEPGEYPFVCTFPGHWVRMYGVMLVVDNLEAWEAKRIPPKDPMTGQPYATTR